MAVVSNIFLYFEFFLYLIETSLIILLWSSLGFSKESFTLSLASKKDFYNTFFFLKDRAKKKLRFAFKFFSCNTTCITLKNKLCDKICITPKCFSWDTCHITLKYFHTICHIVQKFLHLRQGKFLSKSFPKDKFPLLHHHQKFTSLHCFVPQIVSCMIHRIATKFGSFWNNASHKKFLLHVAPHWIFFHAKHHITTKIFLCGK